jgi:hypothetical protein
MFVRADYYRSSIFVPKKIIPICLYIYIYINTPVALATSFSRKSAGGGRTSVTDLTASRALPSLGSLCRKSITVRSLILHTNFYDIFMCITNGPSGDRIYQLDINKHVLTFQK